MTQIFVKDADVHSGILSVCFPIESTMMSLDMTLACTLKRDL
jgi:hypothetical protein